MDIFDAAAAGNLAMIAKKVSGKGKVEDEEELDPGAARGVPLFAFSLFTPPTRRRTP